MLKQLVRFSLTQRLFVGVLAAILCVLGWRAWQNLPIDAFPDISPTQVKLILKAPGMTAEEIERQVTQRLETELLGIPHQQMLRSTTKYAITDITLDFLDGTDIYWARQQVNERLAAVRDELPDVVEGGVAPMSTPLSEMFMFTLENPNLSLLERRRLLDWEVRPILRAVPGVADVNILGGFARTYQITPRPAVMAEAGLSLESLQTVVAQNNLNVGLGRLEQGNDALIVRTQGRLRNLTELGDLVVASGRDGTYRLHDVAEVSIGHLARYGAVTRDGEETTQALVIALKDSNTDQVVSGVKAALAALEPTLPAGSHLNVFYDRAELIDTAIGTISNALIQAVVLVIILLAVFLGHLRAALVVSLSLPLSALATFLLMSYTGLSANLMSLGGLVIAIGMIVDSSVVVVENVLSRLASNPGLPRLHVILRAVGEVAVPVVSGTVIVIIVFSPLLTLTGLEGKLFTPVALTIVFAMVSALVLALTVVPLLASVLLGKASVGMPFYMKTLQNAYRASLQRVLARPLPLAIAVSLVLVASGVLFVNTGRTFMPVLDEGDIIVQLEKSPSISLAASIELDRQVEHALLERVPEIRQIVARTGSDELGLDPMGLNETDIFMELAPVEDWRFASKDELIAAIRDVMQAFPGISFGFTQPIQMRVSEMLTGSTGDVSIKLFGDDLEVLAGLAHETARIVRGLDGAVDVQAAVTDGGKFLVIEPQQAIARAQGLSVDELALRLKTQLEGVVFSEVVEGRERTPVVFSNTATNGPSNGPATVRDMEQQMVTLPAGGFAQLKDIARVSLQEGPLLIEREQGRRFAVVTTNIDGRDTLGFVDELQAEMDTTLVRPSGYSVEFGGEFENQQRATRSLMLVVPGALLLILIILFATFQSLQLAGLILANIPFALMGGVIALFISGEYLSVPASVGLIALLGVAVLNAVVMISYFEQSRGRRALSERIIEGAASRLRPVLMTATTALFGLLPLVFATGPGAEIQKPLAIVVIGGLVTSTLTTLYLLPVAYRLLEVKRHG